MRGGKEERSCRTASGKEALAHELAERLSDPTGIKSDRALAVGALGDAVAGEEAGHFGISQAEVGARLGDVLRLLRLLLGGRELFDELVLGAGISIGYGMRDRSGRHTIAAPRGMKNMRSMGGQRRDIRRPLWSLQRTRFFISIGSK